MKKLLTLILLLLSFNVYSQQDTINAVVIEDGRVEYDYANDTTEYHLETTEGDVRCDKRMYDHVLLNVPYRAVFVVKTDGNKWLVKVETYTTE